MPSKAIFECDMRVCALHLAGHACVGSACVCAPVVSPRLPLHVLSAPRSHRQEFCHMTSPGDPWITGIVGRMAAIDPDAESGRGRLHGHTNDGIYRPPGGYR